MAAGRSADDTDFVDFQFHRLDLGGPVGIGLEAQGDVGLSLDRYVAVPDTMRHKPIIQLEPILAGSQCPYGGLWTTTIYPPEITPKDPKEIFFHRGRYWYFAAVPASILDQGSVNFYGLPSENTIDDPKEPYDYRKGSAQKYDEWHRSHIIEAEHIVHAGPIPAAATCPDGSVAQSVLVHYNEKRWGTLRGTSSGARAIQASVYVPFPAKIGNRGAPKVTMNELAWFIELNRKSFGAHPMVLNGVTARLYAYMLGLMSSADECEVTYHKCNGASTTSDDDVDHVKALIASDNFCSQVLTMCAARTISWRQTGHCTGGNVAVGYVQKILEQSDWVTVKGRVDVADTDLFYNAYHAVNNRNMMVVLCPDRYETTARFTLDMGVPIVKRAEASVIMRLEAKSGVAGTKLLIDSLTVIKTAAVDCMIETFPNLDALGRLADVCKVVRSNGLLTGTACRFWVRHNPFGMKAVPVDQRDPTLHEICKYASIYAISYMHGNTLSKAKSLINFAKQNMDEGYKKLWSELRKRASTLRVSEAAALVHVIQARRGSARCADFLSADPLVRARASRDIQGVLAQLGVDAHSIEQYKPLTEVELAEAQQKIAAADEIEGRIAQAAERAAI